MNDGYINVNSISTFWKLSDDTQTVGLKSLCKTATYLFKNNRIKLKKKKKKKEISVSITVHLSSDLWTVCFSYLYMYVCK